MFCSWNLRSFSNSAFLKSLFFTGFCFAVTSCDLAANYTKIDRPADMEVQDFRDGLSERLPEMEADDIDSLDSIPSLQPYIANSSEALKSMPLVSVSVNQSVPLRDILYELAQQVEYDLELDPNIRGSIIFTARNKPFDMVIDRIAGIAGLRYEFKDSFLRVEVDTPYIQTYKIDYLNFVRDNAGSVNTTVSVVSGEDGGADTGSSFSASSSSNSDFWGELELNLEQILGGASGSLKTKRDPRITVAEQNPEVAAVSPEADGEGVSVQPPEAVLNVESLPIDEEDTADSDAAAGNGNGATYSLNKQAGLVNIMAPKRVHKQVEEYLNKLRIAVTSQVLIEAKVFEVSLFDEFITGVEWSTLTNSGSLLGDGVVRFLGTDDNIIGGIIPPGGEVATSATFSLGAFGSDVDVFIDAISGFGTVRALASPRLTVLNNQSAVLNVVTNRVFFEIDLERETDEDTNTDTLEIDSEIKSVPEGVLINVQPSINLDDRTISMLVRPTITSIAGTVQDPAVALVAGSSGIVSRVPEVNVQEIDTVIKVNSGQAVVMGGLLQDKNETTRQSVPVLGEVPLVGALFRSENSLSRKTELVIFLKATLLQSPGDSIHNTDRDLYRTFSGDRRPLDL